MSAYSATSASAAQAAEFAAKRLSHQLASFLAPILRSLDQRLGRRLVSTFLATLIAIVQWRNRAHGLLLSELGAYLLTPAQAPAGTKRVSNLLRSERWSARLIADTLWQRRIPVFRRYVKQARKSCWCGMAAYWKSPKRSRMMTYVPYARARRAGSNVFAQASSIRPAVAQSVCLVCTGWACWCSAAPARRP
jgi:hypothetical protein